jgi:16S rRNA processing protein RimM
VEPLARPPFITVARIARTRGNKGEVLADSHTDFPERFSLLEEVWLEFPDRTRAQMSLERVWEHKGRYVFKFQGVDTISEAERLAGAWIQVASAEAVVLPEGTYFDHDLVGCTVVSASGEELGSVAEILRIAGNHQLVVRGIRGEFYIPAAGGFCREIFLEDRRIVVELPEGLMDLNG